MSKKQPLGYLGKIKVEIHAGKERKKRASQIDEYNKTSRKRYRQTKATMQSLADTKTRMINAAIEKDGFYIDENGQIYMQKQKTKRVKLKKEDIQIERHPMIKRHALTLGFSFRVSMWLTSIKQFFVNLFSRKGNEPTRQSDNLENVSEDKRVMPEGLKQTPKENNEPRTTFEHFDIPIDIDKNFEDLERINMNNSFAVSDGDITYGFQEWLDKNQTNKDIDFNNITPLVFEYLKVAAITGYFLSESSISKILSYATKRECEFNEQENSITVFMKAKNKTAAVTIGQDGNLTYPKTFNYHGDTIENICNSENIAKVPSYVEQLAASFSNNPGLFITLLKQDKYPTDSLECVKDYIKENEEIKKYAVAIDEFEKSGQITDRNAIKQLNFFVKDLSCLGMSPETVMECAFMRPAMDMMKMENPSQYISVYNCAKNFLLSGYAPSDAFGIASTLFAQDGEKYRVVSPEVKKIVSQEMQRFMSYGIDTQTSIELVKSFNSSRELDVVKLNATMIEMEVKNDVPSQDILNKDRIEEYNADKIAGIIASEFAKIPTEDILEMVQSDKPLMTTAVFKVLDNQKIDEISKHLPVEIQEDFSSLRGMTTKEFRENIGNVVLSEEPYEVQNDEPQNDNRQEYADEPIAFDDR